MARIWADHGPRPRKVHTFQVSNDPRLEGTGRRGREAFLPTNSTHLGDRPAATRSGGCCWPFDVASR